MKQDYRKIDKTNQIGKNNNEKKLGQVPISIAHTHLTVFQLQ